MVNHKSLTLRRFRISVCWFKRKALCGFSNEYWSRKEGWLRKEFLDELLRANLSSRKYKVRELQLNLHYEHPINKPYRLPRDIFSSRNLSILKLCFCYIGSHVATVKLSGVETLSLKSIQSSAGAFTNLISSCCNVKNLELSYCEPVEVDLSISLQELRKVAVLDCGLRNFTIDAPKLQHVKLQVRNNDLKFSMPGSLSLMYADLDLSGGNDRQIRNLVHEVGRSKVVKLRIYSKELPLGLFEDCPPCCNVKELVVDGSVTLTSTLPFLKLFPNLEDLTVAYPKYDNTWIAEDDYMLDEGGGGDELQHVSLYCLKYSLKRIKIENFRCHKVLVELVKFLAENAVVLETMNLTKCYGYLNRLLEMKNNLIMRKASRFAQIICT